MGVESLGFRLEGLMFITEGCEFRVPAIESVKKIIYNACTVIKHFPLKTRRGTSLLGYPGKVVTRLRTVGVFLGGRKSINDLRTVPGSLLSGG